MEPVEEEPQVFEPLQTTYYGSSQGEAHENNKNSYNVSLGTFYKNTTNLRNSKPKTTYDYSSYRVTMQNFNSMPEVNAEDAVKLERELFLCPVNRFLKHKEKTWTQYETSQKSLLSKSPQNDDSLIIDDTKATVYTENVRKSKADLQKEKKCLEKQVSRLNQEMKTFHSNTTTDLG